MDCHNTFSRHSWCPDHDAYWLQQSSDFLSCATVRLTCLVLSEMSSYKILLDLSFDLAPLFHFLEYLLVTIINMLLGEYYCMYKTKSVLKYSDVQTLESSHFVFSSLCLILQNVTVFFMKHCPSWWDAALPRTDLCELSHSEGFFSWWPALPPFRPRVSLLLSFSSFFRSPFPPVFICLSLSIALCHPISVTFLSLSVFFYLYLFVPLAE